MKQLLLILLITLFCNTLANAAERPLPSSELPSQVTRYLKQHQLQLTQTAADAQKLGYILVTGVAKGPRLKAQRAATVAAQRDIAVILADLPGTKEKPAKQMTQTGAVTKTVVNGKVKKTTLLFKHYDASQQTSYLLMRKELP